MKPIQFAPLAVFMLFCSAMLVVGLYLLTRFSKLFKRSIRVEVVRQNVVVWLVAICLILSVSPTTPDFYSALIQNKVLNYYTLDCLGITFEVLFVFNISRLVARYLERRRVTFKKRMVLILATICTCTLIMGVPLNYLGNQILGDGASLKNVEFTLLFNFYVGCMTGLVYITMNYVDLERQKKLNEKELEVSKLRELKTQADLDVLHSKINPHFLYNALNSIADLSITDGKKARKMTIALADLFRYSINYSSDNYSTIKEEVEMAEVYLAIEKIRFEDKLTYTVVLDNTIAHYLVPRFILQPVVENAVKHGLKATGRMTEICVELKQHDGNLIIAVADNGPDFPEELVPGYGVRSMYDKLDLLFPNNYEIHFSNHPRKKVSIYIHKLLKNESAI